MKRYNSLKFILAIFPFILSTGCGNNQENNQKENSTQHTLIPITQKQFSANNMKLGKLTTHNFENTIDCNGYIIAPAHGKANISTQIGGIVKQVNLSLGDYVKKGDILCLLTSNDFITLQKDFAETSAKLRQLSGDYKRSKTLYKEKIGSEKNFIAIESNFKAMQAKYKALKIQLQLVNLDVNKIEKSDFYLTYPILTPISGQISDIHINIGQYVEQQQKLMEIVDNSSLQLKISVFEKDINYLKPGKTFKFYTINNKDSVYSATLKNIGKSINSKTKAINCLAEINKQQSVSLINNSFIKAEIISYEFEAPALRNEALIKSENNYFILSLVKSEGNTYFFEKLKVKTGRKSKNYIEIIDGDELIDVLVTGAYNLQTE